VSEDDKTCFVNRLAPLCVLHDQMKLEAHYVAAGRNCVLARKFKHVATEKARHFRLDRVIKAFVMWVLDNISDIGVEVL
jgi:hypothetical protein